MNEQKREKTSAPPAVLTIAGLDPSSGAGVTADLKVFAAHGLYGLSCPTALTVQSTQGVRRSAAVDAALISETLACLAEDIPIAGVKIGMLGSEAALRAVAAWLQTSGLAVPVVLDPVLRSSSGHPLLPEPALPAFLELLLPLASVLTPNLPEAALLAGMPPAAGEEALAEALLPLTGAVVLTGGHGADPETVTDLLLTRNEREHFSGPRIRTTATHGTGCAFSSALLAGLALGRGLPDAVRAAKLYVEGALRAAYPIGQGRGPMHHLFPYSPKDLTAR